MRGVSEWLAKADEGGSCEKDSTVIGRVPQMNKGIADGTLREFKLVEVRSGSQSQMWSKERVYQWV